MVICICEGRSCKEMHSQFQVHQQCRAIIYCKIEGVDLKTECQKKDFIKASYCSETIKMIKTFKLVEQVEVVRFCARAFKNDRSNDEKFKSFFGKTMIDFCKVSEKKHAIEQKQ